MAKTNPIESVRSKASPHLHREDWLRTPSGDPRGYIDPHTLRELWFHTGTKCNLGCRFCLEGAGPASHRIELITFDETIPFIDEAIAMGVQQIAFTGGEPFINPAMIDILDCALEKAPCLVLSNGTKPMRNQLERVFALRDKPHLLKFRISLDYLEQSRHDEARGQGSFAMALATLCDLNSRGLQVSVARHREEGESTSEIDAEYIQFLADKGIKGKINIISFPELHRPGVQVEVPCITENCMTTYKSELTRAQFMCAYGKMIVKINGRPQVYACTLVDDDPDYSLGDTLEESMKVRVMLKHHRCYSCFAADASCSE